MRAARGPDDDDLRGAWASAGRALAGCHDIVTGRVAIGEVPDWAAARGWAPFLEGLSDAALAAAERDGLLSLEGAPASLLDHAREIDALARVAPLDEGPSPEVMPRRRSSERKGAQVAAFAAACRGLGAGRARIVDVGSGHGHLTRGLAAALGCDAVGLERDARRVSVASALSEPSGGRARFVAVDVVRDGVDLRPDDLAVGLHACGELGDLLIDEAAGAGASLALVSCCLQKIRAAERAPRGVPDGVAPRDLVWPRDALGLSNLSLRAEGVEASLGDNLRARRARHALGWLLRARGLDVAPGAAIAGVNRRQAHAPFAQVAARVFAHRGLAAPTSGELREAERAAAVSYSLERRYSLPRDVLGRLMEVFVLHDRALHLRSRGYTTRSGVLFSDAASPRNLALLAALP